MFKQKRIKEKDKEKDYGNYSQDKKINNTIKNEIVDKRKNLISYDENPFVVFKNNL